MNRSTIVLTATAAGLGATLGFNTHQPSAATRTTTTAAATAASSTSSASSSSSSSSSGTFTSAVEPTRYGPLQLKVTVSGGKITGIEALQMPSNDPKSVAIGNYAEPLLRQSALSR